MALDSQVWPPATPMPMAESSLYRQRLEVIAEKRRLQEEIRSARRELEEEKLRVERLKRKSLRERWLMDGSAEGPEPLEDLASKDPQSPEGQAQARIRNLEDSLFTLQSQLQLLQSASTGAQHRPAGRPSWRRQGPRPLSQPTLETGPEGHTDVDKRASMPACPVGISPEPKEEPAGASSEANGPCPGHSSPLTGQTAEGGITTTKGEDVVEVVWEGLRPTEDCARTPTGLELEAKVEQVVLEALGAGQRAGSVELPAWVKEDRGVVEVVWEGLGAGDSTEVTQTSSPPGLQEQFQAEASRSEEGVPRDGLGGDGQGGPAVEEGSFIWVERVTLSEDWEELLMEGLEGPVGPGKEREEGRAGAQPGPDGDRAEVMPEETRQGSQAVVLEPGRTGGEEGRGTGEQGGEARKEGEGVLSESKIDQPKREVEARGGDDGNQLEAEEGGEENREATEESLVAGKKHGGGEEKGSEGLLDGETEGGEKVLDGETEGGEKRLAGETEGGEKVLAGETEGGEKVLDWETEGGEKVLDGETEGGEKVLDGETEGGEKVLDGETEGGEKVLDGETEGGEKVLDGEGEGGEKVLDGEGGGERPSKVEQIHGAQGEVSLEEQRALGEGGEPPGEAVTKAGTPQEVKQEPPPEDEGLRGPEKQEGLVEEEAGEPRPLAEGQGLPGDTTPLLAEAPAPQRPAERQPLLQREGPSANPSAHPAPTYAPARQPEPASRPEGEEAGGPKQKTCQCCAVM